MVVTIRSGPKLTRYASIFWKIAFCFSSQNKSLTLNVAKKYEVVTLIMHSVMRMRNEKCLFVLMTVKSKLMFILSTWLIVANIWMTSKLCCDCLEPFGLYVYYFSVLWHFINLQVELWVSIWYQLVLGHLHQSHLSLRLN